MKKIAILGATSHIAKNLVFNFKKSEKNILFLFARSKDKLDDFLKIFNCNEKINKIDINDFCNEKYDAIINCIGIPKK